MTTPARSRNVGGRALAPAAVMLLAAGAALAQVEQPQEAPQPDQPAERPAGASAQNAPAADEITPELDTAIARGITYLVGEQNPDGSFGSGRYSQSVAITALACIALMGDGNLPDRGPHGDAVQRGLEYILAASSETGLLAGDATTGPMYGHGFATLFLGEVYGMTAGGGDTELSDRVHEALVKAVRLIEKTQNEEGGWRYNPVPYDADVSVTICQIMGLRAARNAGIAVSKETIDRAVEYVRRCQNPDGGFRYQLTTGRSAWPRSGAGVASLFYAGVYEDDAIETGLNYLVREALPGETAPSQAHYFYGHYYAAQTMYLAGGDHWARWWPAVRQELLQRQRAEDGSWADASAGSAYGTSMALIILQMPKRLLPIFQK